MAGTGAGRARVDVAAFIRDAPADVLEALLRCLSPKWILRMRAVCKAWRDKLRQDAVLAPLHQAEPPRLLLCFDRAACPDRYVQLRDYCVESLDISSGKLRHVLRFTDGEYYESDEATAARDDAPPIEASRVDYGRMEKENYVDDGFKQLLLVHASIDGYLLVSFSFRWYVINPATRHWVSVPDLTDFDVIGFYEDVTSGEYRVLCLRRRRRTKAAAPTCSYHVVTVSPVKLRQRRRIGRPISPAAPQDHGLASGVEAACVSPPLQFRNFKRNLHLHWPPQELQGYHILVFNTGREEFSWKKPPPARDEDMRLFEFPNGNLGLSVSGKNKATLELWCLEDYLNEGWVCTYKIQLELQQMPALYIDDLWIPAVVSSEGDVLIESPHGLFHCDRNGNLVRKFCFPQIQSHRVLPVRHVLRESLLRHPMLQAPKVDGDEPPFFHWLCGDPS